MSSERWLPVVGYEDYYEVSDQGRVRSLDRVVTDDLHGGRRRRIKGRILTPHRGASRRSGYTRVGLMRDGTRKTGWVYVLVARAFLGPLPEGMVTCHNDGDGTNNALSNLRYDTPASNMQDQIKHGVHGEASKTECVNGHPFDDDNTRFRAGGRHRVCLSCKRDYDQAYEARVAGTAPPKHGINGYTRYGCRCDECRAANAAKQRAARYSRRLREAGSQAA